MVLSNYFIFSHQSLQLFLGITNLFIQFIYKNSKTKREIKFLEYAISHTMRDEQEKLEIESNKRSYVTNIESEKIKAKAQILIIKSFNFQLSFHLLIQLKNLLKINKDKKI